MTRPSIRIDRSDDERLQGFGAVGDPALVRARGAFVAEGRRAVEDLLMLAPERVQALLLTETALASMGGALEGLPADTPVYVVAGPAFLREVTGYRFHQGCLALAGLPEARTLDDLVSADAGATDLLVVLEGVTDPDNVGAIFRTATAFGARGVLLAAGCAHPLYRKALRTSLGTGLRLPFAEAPAWPAELDALASRGYLTVALTPDSGADRLTVAADRVSGHGAALLLGSEGRGLSEAALARAAVRARIPMTAEVDSLNVAASAAVALHVLTRGHPARR